MVVVLFFLRLGVTLAWQPESIRQASQLPYPRTAAPRSCFTHTGQSNASISGAVRRRSGHLLGATPRPGMLGAQFNQHPAELVEHRTRCRENIQSAGHKSSRRNALLSHCLGKQLLPPEPGEDLAPALRCTGIASSMELTRCSAPHPLAAQK